MGRFRAVYLKNVVAEAVDPLEPNGRPEPATYGVERIHMALRQRTRRHQWNG